MDDGALASYSLVELALDRLSREILSGRVVPGERLVEEQLTRRLGISRAPLREALRLLAQQGLVEHIPRRGVRVATLSATDVRQLYEVREVLERHAVSTLPPAPDRTRLHAALSDMRATDQFAVADAHRRFHTEVVDLAGNRQLTAVYASVLVRIQLYMAVNLRREAEVADPYGGIHRHQRLLTALDNGTIMDELARHGARAYLNT
ncbi:MAG TPA: GntR family transcriptional regulator [Rugosimonospora sp.]|nr:GntR family transcriptional regulator [Rugosimonospora sp.]